MYDLGYRIKEIRTQRGITQSELAKRINKSKSAVSGYESNAQIPPSEVLVSIATVLNVSLDYLVGFEMEEPISLKNYTSQQKNAIGLLLEEFSNPTNSSPKLSAQQIAIIQELIYLFSGRKWYSLNQCYIRKAEGLSTLSFRFFVLFAVVLLFSQLRFKR